MPSAGEYFRLAMQFEDADGNDIYNIFDYVVSAGTCTDAELLTVLAAAMTSAYGAIQSDIANTVDDQQGIVNKMIWSVDKWIVDRYVGAIFPTITFNNVNDQLPNQIAPLVSFLTTQPKCTGKKFLPPAAEDRQDAGVLSGTTLANMVNFGAAVLSAMTPGSATVNFCLLRKNGTIAYPYGVVANALVATQRRRKPGVGT